MLKELVLLLQFVFSSFWVWFGLLIYLLIITRDMNKIISFLGKKISSFFDKVLANYRKKTMMRTENATTTGSPKGYSAPNRNYVPKP